MFNLQVQEGEQKDQKLHIKKAAVIGSGVMGATIAAHLANVGVSCLLLDIVPSKLEEDEEKKGLSLDDAQVRNRLATNAIQRLKKMKPAPFYDSSFSSLIQAGNIEDHLPDLKDVDWIIEVVIENVEIKQHLFGKIEQVWQPGTIVSTNTSGISIHDMVKDRSADFQSHFLGTHFFNPPRYMKLLEIIPHEHTNPDILDYMTTFCERTLGKGVVRAKDTPNFIANRIGVYGLLVCFQEMDENGYTVEEVDAVSGPAMGRPKSATFRTLDLVGLDTFVHVANNVYANVEGAGEKASFHVPEILNQMVEKKWIGEKSGQGFYKKVKTENGKEILALDLQTMEYAPRQKVKSQALEASKQASGPAAKLKALYEQDDKYATLAWNLLKHVLIYSAEKVGEIAESIVEIDRAMRWGFNWDIGPFEAWDSIGLERSVKRMEDEGLSVPQWVKNWINDGNESFYKVDGQDLFYSDQHTYQKEDSRPEHLSLPRLKKQKNNVIRSNSGASLIDLGDGVACLEFHSPNNAIGPDILFMIKQSLDEVRQNYAGLVIANEGRNFCVGANVMQLLMEAQAEEWDEVDFMIRQFQQTMYDLKYFEKPVVVAPHQMTLGGGVEVCMAADQVLAHAETYYGLVEVGVGLIPGGGGCKEMALRASQRVENVKDADSQPFINQAFELIGMAKVATSAHEAKKLGLLQQMDRVILPRDYQMNEAKQTVLGMVQQGYIAPEEKPFSVVGENGKAVLKLAAYTLRQGGYISDHDQYIAGKLAHVLAGGNVPAGTKVTEQYILDLEREAFLSLCGEPKTQQRIQHMLTKGKPLRN